MAGLWSLRHGRAILNHYTPAQCATWRRWKKRMGPSPEEVTKCRRDSDLYLMLVDENMVDPCWELPKVVIVGAGMAGLSAAHYLSKAGITDITVLEAVDRPGGRIMSCNMKNFVVDLGASYIEGAGATNHVYNLACGEGLFHFPAVTMTNPFSGIFMTSCGKAVPPVTQSTAHHVFDAIEREALELFPEGTKYEGSLLDYFMERIFDEATSFPESTRALANKVMVGRTNEVSAYWGTHLDNIDADQYGSYTPLTGGNVRISTGMVGVLAPLIREAPECIIRYCKPVEKIEWCGQIEKEVLVSMKDPCKVPRRRCRVMTCDGDCFEADYVIITTSLGYLKKNHESMFEPGLPDYKVEGIKNLGYGHLNNIYLIYRDPFWVWREGVVRMAWGREELDGSEPRSTEWVKGIGQIVEVPSSVQLLMANVGGQAAKFIEGLDHFRMGEDITCMLRSFTGDPTLPYPLAILNSKWTSNQYQLGAKPFIKSGSNASHVHAMARPVPEVCGDEIPALLFAGDATDAGYLGTLHGARASGIREAYRIIQYTHRFCGRPRCAATTAIAPSDECD